MSIQFRLEYLRSIPSHVTYQLKLLTNLRLEFFMCKMGTIAAVFITHGFCEHDISESVAGSMKQRKTVSKVDDDSDVNGENNDNFMVASHTEIFYTHLIQV